MPSTFPKPTSILMFQCPECLIVWSWVEGTMCQTGCGSSKEDLMYDYFGPEIGNLQHFSSYWLHVHHLEGEESPTYLTSNTSREFMETMELFIGNFHSGISLIGIKQADMAEWLRRQT
ncbi:hypothetical protein OUZ56_024152 [Daphnia magna]|uniref:Uncharacterized protein n=1 Tax=Daphnia magna TaxID=35525 RepID=A0ABR0B0A0_9CRUS|nr:hypothetical protein OUZ56_024152 [Daphnia magna]